MTSTRRELHRPPSSICREVCDAVCDVWQQTPAKKVILNLPARSIWANPISRPTRSSGSAARFKRRDSIVACRLPPHNDRGHRRSRRRGSASWQAPTGFEGTLSANGETHRKRRRHEHGAQHCSARASTGHSRSGHDESCAPSEYCNQTARAPAPSILQARLVFTAFRARTRTRQKGSMRWRSAIDEFWECHLRSTRRIWPQLRDVIRVNSQSGKGGVAYLNQRPTTGLDLPRGPARSEFSKVVQDWTDRIGKEASWPTLDHVPGDHRARPSWRSADYATMPDAEGRRLFRDRRVAGAEAGDRGVGNGPIMPSSMRSSRPESRRSQVLDTVSTRSAHGADARAAPMSRPSGRRSQAVRSRHRTATLVAASLRAVASGRRAGIVSVVSPASGTRGDIPLHDGRARDLTEGVARAQP